MFWIAVFTIGAAQSAMLAAALWKRPVNAQANRVLAVWLAIVALDLGLKAAYLADPGVVPDDAVRASRTLPFLYSSFFYVYVRALITGTGFVRSDVAHASAFVLVLGWALWHLATHGPPADGRWVPGWFDPLLFVWAMAYLGAALHRIAGFRRTLHRTRADADRLSMRWLTLMAGCQLLIWAVAAAHWLLRLPAIDHLAIYAAVAAWVSVIGWCSLSQPPATALPEAEAPPEPTPTDDPRTRDVEARLAHLMQAEALYRAPSLSIAQLARRSGYPEYLVSLVINRRLGGNFWDYVNRYRIEAVCACLDAGDTRTILDIAYDAGFTSKSTFNASFKQIVGETPSAYRRRHAAAAAPPHTAPD